MKGSGEERKPLLSENSQRRPERDQKTHLTSFFAAACIVDQFGVNPIVVLPRAVILCGWVGYPLTLLVFSLTIYTAMLLGRCWVIAEHLDCDMKLRSRYPYAALAEKVWGRDVSKVINLYINVCIFGSNIPALLVASQNLQFFVSVVTNDTFNFSHCYWLIILGVGLCPLTWLGSPKDSKWISVVSTSLVVATALITWTSMVTDDTKSYLEVPSPDWASVGITFGILAFQFGCHPAILTIQTDMHDKSKLSFSILLSFLTTGGLSAVTLFMATSLYGSGTHANLIQGLPPSLLLYIGIMTVTFQLFLSTVVGGCSLFQDVEDKLGVPAELCWQRCCIRSGLVMLAVMAAEMLPRFDLVMGLLGGLFTGPITFVLPPLLYKRFRKLLAENRAIANHKEDESLREVGSSQNRLFRFLKNHFFTLNVNLDEGSCTIWERAVLFCIVCLGFCATASAIYFSVIGAIERTHHVPPCIVNVKKASVTTKK